MVDTFSMPHVMICSPDDQLTISDDTGSILGPYFRRLHRPGYGQLLLDIWTPCGRFGWNSDLHVSNTHWFTVGSLKILHMNRIFFVPETLYFEGNIREQHQARRLSIRLKPFEHAEVPKWSTAFFRPVQAL